VSTSVPQHPRATGLAVVDGELVVRLEDERSLHVPLEWFPKLRAATLEDLAAWHLVGRGTGFTGRSSTKTFRYAA